MAMPKGVYSRISIMREHVRKAPIAFALDEFYDQITELQGCGHMTATELAVLLIMPVKQVRTNLFMLRDRGIIGYSNGHYHMNSQNENKLVVGDGKLCSIQC